MLWYPQKQHQEKTLQLVAPFPLVKMPFWAGERQTELPAAKHCCKETPRTRDELRLQPFKEWWRLNIGELSTPMQLHAACSLCITAPTPAQSHDGPLKQQLLSYGLRIENFKSLHKVLVVSWTTSIIPPEQQDQLCPGST